MNGIVERIDDFLAHDGPADLSPSNLPVLRFGPAAEQAAREGMRASSNGKMKGRPPI
jgi:hypothetical protein